MRTAPEFRDATWTAAPPATRSWPRQAVYAATLLWLCALGFLFQGTRGIWEPDEGRYVGVAQQMLHTGEWLVPRLEPSESHLSKPPLTYWAIAASLKLFGENEWAARLPNALAFIATGLLVLWLAEGLGLRRPWWAVAIWSTMPLPFVAANIVTTDALLMLFETAGIAGFVACRVGREAPRPQWRFAPWLMWCAFGLAFFTKGPPGLLPLLPLLLFARWESGAQALRALLRPGPVIAALAIALWWFATLLAMQPGLWRYFLVHELFDRVATSLHERNPGWSGLFEVYGAALLVGLLPWSVPLAVARIRQGTRRDVDWSRRLLLLCWLLPLLVFSLAQSRLHLYLVPLTVSFALWAARVLEGQVLMRSRTVLLLAAISAVALLSLKGHAGGMSYRRDARQMAADIRASVDVEAYRQLRFVEHRPWYGLGFYLPLPVDGIDLVRAHSTPGADGRPLVCAQLESGERTLYVAPMQVAPVARQVAEQCGRAPWQVVGHVAGFTLLAEQHFPGGR